MPKAVILLDDSFDLNEKFRVELKVFEVMPSEKFPDGIKVRFVLIDVIRGFPRLLLDNHEPFGFHVHEKMPEEKENRKIIKVQSYLEALDEFWILARRVISNET